MEHSARCKKKHDSSCRSPRTTASQADKSRVGGRVGCDRGYLLRRPRCDPSFLLLLLECSRGVVVFALCTTFIAAIKMQLWVSIKLLPLGWLPERVVPSTQFSSLLPERVLYGFTN